MPDFYSEPFLCLAGLTHKSALITWGAFYFRVKNGGEEFKLVEDDDLKHVHPPRKDSIGATSKSYGPARIDVFDKDDRLVASANTQGDVNHCWVAGLTPDTEYFYRVFVNDEEWAQGPRRNWEPNGDDMGLGPKRRPYINRFRTYPAPLAPAPQPFTFAVIGDFGVGVKSADDRGQRQIAEALDRAVLEHDVRFILTTGDNIYRTGGLFGVIGGDTGKQDDDWYFTYYQPYRYVINRIPVYPSIGNHDADESESKDDRAQVVDNFYLNERIAGEEAAGRASTAPGLFYRFRFGSTLECICIDTSKEPDQFPDRLFRHPKHAAFLDSAFPDVGGAAPTMWRIPFGHHPPRCAGPRHGNTGGMESLVARFERAGVRLSLSGHEHNFQHAVENKVNYVLTGGAGKIRTDRPSASGFTSARTVTWAPEYHFLLVTIDGSRATIRAIGALSGTTLMDIKRSLPDKTKPLTSDPIVISL
jgi:hypothetical protein